MEELVPHRFVPEDKFLKEMDLAENVCGTPDQMAPEEIA